MRLARREFSRPNGRRVTAKTRLKSGDSSRRSRARLPTKPVAPASSTIFCSPSAMLQHKSALRRRQDGSARICYKMRLLGALVVLIGSAAWGVTDSDRVQAYHEFRAAFDARRYQDALPLAEKLVSMTEEQYGAADRALVNPLSNLGTTQYRLHDYKTAEKTFLRTIKIVEDSGGGADRALLRPLHGLGATYFATHQYEDASLILKRALDLSRNLDGLFNLEQMSILDPLIDSLVALDRHEEAERAYDYSIRVAESAYGKT